MYTEHLHIPVGVGTLHVERLGRGGPAVLLLHGFATSAFLWRQVAPRLASAGFTTVAIDLLGHGESDRPIDAAYTASAQADYVERALTALRLGEVAVVSQDMGALVAAMLAAQRPSLVRSLLLLEPPDPDDLPGPMIRALQRGSARAALSANTLFGARPLLEPWLLERTGTPAEPDRLLARYLASFVGPTGAAELLQLASHVALLDGERQRLRDVRVDTTLWLGSADGDPGPPAIVDQRESTVSPIPEPPPEDRLRYPGAGSVPLSGVRRERLAAWSALLPASPVRALPMPTPAGALVAEVSPVPLAKIILAGSESSTAAALEP